ncbi:minor tail protein [Streptomyces phage RemusLoopin]|uniref:Minor tail protein n=1 Tax=Streptomyces phage RemusLoopin TaxID=2562346 RepID=A0A4D6E3U0_9CAUD|nr:minor tail protein [Streptomyces phage RemusLoopin]
MAELNDWTCEYNGLVMGEPDSAVSIVAVDGLLTLPEIRSSDLTLVQRHGLYAGDDYMNGRTVTVTLEVYGSTREEFTQALVNLQAAFMPGDIEKPLRFRFPGVAADQTGYVMARPRKRSAPLDLNFANMVCNVVVELYATSPYVYGDAPRESVVRSYEREADMSGLTFPAAVPWLVKGSGEAPADPITWLTQFGSVAARPQVVITAGASPTLWDDSTGQFFSVDWDGDIVIDSAGMTVTTTQGTDITGLVKVGSVWPEFGPGLHRLRLTSRDEFTSARAVITWVDRWV